MNCGHTVTNPAVSILALIDLGASVLSLCSAVAARSCALYINDMSEHRVTLKWERGGAEFLYQKYPRDHTWIFDGGHTMTATAAPAYLGNPANVDPEKRSSPHSRAVTCLRFWRLRASRSSCSIRMRTRRLVIWRKMAKAKAVTRVELRPKITWGGDRTPSSEQLDKMHHTAHENCFIANSVKTEVTVTNL